MFKLLLYILYNRTHALFLFSSYRIVQRGSLNRTEWCRACNATNNGACITAFPRFSIVEKMAAPVSTQEFCLAYVMGLYCTLTYSENLYLN